MFVGIRSKIFFVFQLFFLLFISQFANSQTPYVILISIDGLRWDYADRAETPVLDSIRANGVSALSFKPVFPSMSFPTHYSIITGLYPENHGIIANNFIDPFSGEKFSSSNGASANRTKWYNGEAFWETARRYGIKTASHSWPGSEVGDKDRQPNYLEKYDSGTSIEEKFECALGWLQLPEGERPHFIAMYFDEVDAIGHSFGPDSAETAKSVEKIDKYLRKFLQNLYEINLSDSINIIIVSGQGMTASSSDRIIEINKYFANSIIAQNYGSFITIEPARGFEKNTYDSLKAAEWHFKIFHKSEIPKHLHYSKHPFILSYLLIAEPGWLFADKNAEIYGAKLKGSHGYDNECIDMHGVFYATGPKFKTGCKVGTLNSIDVYPLLCRIFGIADSDYIDGKAERIEFILKK